MSDIPVELIVAAFGEEKAANTALKELKSAKRAGLIDIVDAAVIRRDEKNKLHIKETGDLSGGQGAMFGGALGLILGIIAGRDLYPDIGIFAGFQKAGPYGNKMVQHDASAELQERHFKGEIVSGREVPYWIIHHFH